jgi:hypothetical protein
VREAAREAARRSGMSVGEWLNRVIQSDADDYGEQMHFADFDDEADDDRRYERRRAYRGRRREDREYGREATRAHDDLDAVHARLDRLSHQLERMARTETTSTPNYQHSPQLTGAPEAPRQSSPNAQHFLGSRAAPSQRTLSIDDAVADIVERQRTLYGDAPAAAPANAPPQYVPPAPRSHSASGPGFDVGNLEQQLRQITARIEALRPGSDLEATVGAIRSELTHIARQLTEALPRHAVESLEI